MAKRNILKNNEETLREIARPVTEFDEKLKTLLDDMAETMYAEDGVGLAAPQIGIRRRIVVVDIGDKLYELVNPQFKLQSKDEVKGIEGCLSFPNKRGYVIRPSKVVVEAFDRNGNKIEVAAEDFLARAFCHEIDHLDGKVIVDKPEFNDKIFEG